MHRRSALFAVALLALTTATAQAKEGEREGERSDRAQTVNSGTRRSTARQLFSAREERQLKYLGLDYRIGLRTEVVEKATTSDLSLSFSAAKGAGYLDLSSVAGERDRQCSGKDDEGDKAASASREGKGDDEGCEKGAGLAVKVSLGAGRWSEGFDSLMKGAVAERAVSMAVARTYREVLQPGPRSERRVLCDTTGKQAGIVLMYAERESLCSLPNMKVEVVIGRFASGLYPMLEKSQQLRCGVLRLVDEVLGHAACASLAGEASNDVKEIPKADSVEVSRLPVERVAIEAVSKGIDYGICAMKGDGGGNNCKECAVPAIMSTKM